MKTKQTTAIHVVITLLASAGLVGIISLLSINFKNQTEEHVENNLLILDSRIETIIRNLEIFSSYAFSRDVDTAMVNEMIARAWNGTAAERDAIRTELYGLMLPVYQQMERYHFRQLHFHFPDTTSFLRMHAPELFGDYLGDIRSTVRTVNQTQTAITAFEEGRIYNGYRFVYPLFWNGQHCGSVEVSFAMSSFLSRLRDLKNCDYYFGVRKDIVESTVFESQQSNYRESTFSTVYLEDGGLSQDHPMSQAFNYKSKALEQLLAEGRDGGIVSELAGKPVLVLVNHIKNLAANPVGVIISVDNDPAYEVMRGGFFALLIVSTFGYVGLVLALYLLHTERKRLHIMSSTDSLTGLCNRRTISAVLEHELQRYERYKTPLSVMIIDIDDFKQVNDTYGHEEGDKVLKKLATIMMSTLRSTDTIGRWGGEEFITILQNTPFEAAMIAANKLRESVEKNQVSEKKTITISVGVSTYTGKETMDTLVGRADTAMYQAKRSGKNRVLGYSGENPLPNTN
ncbi:MAG: diguanylate cyclase [Spirochaetales bacterium]|nr:diguanylate cyclase [Spirochaetales bacterium]